MYTFSSLLAMIYGYRFIILVLGVLIQSNTKFMGTYQTKNDIIQRISYSKAEAVMILY